MIFRIYFDFLFLLPCNLHEKSLFGEQGTRLHLLVDLVGAGTLDDAVLEAREFLFLGCVEILRVIGCVQ